MDGSASSPQPPDPTTDAPSSVINQNSPGGSSSAAQQQQQPQPPSSSSNFGGGGGEPALPPVLIDVDLDPRLPPDSTSPTGSAGPTATQGGSLPTILPVPGVSGEEETEDPTGPSHSQNPSQVAAGYLPQEGFQSDSGTAGAARGVREPGDGGESEEAPQPPIPPLSVGKKATPKPKRWTPNQTLLAQICDFGIDPVVAEKALFYTNNRSADQAVNWIFDHPEIAEDLRPLDYEGFSSSGDVSPDDIRDIDAAMLNSASHKMVFVINSSLKMGLGKIAAQVGHATLGLYRRLLDEGEARQASLAAWDQLGEMKVVLRGNDHVHLLDLEKRAVDLDIPTYLVQDAGRTQIAAGSMTVLSLFGPGQVVDRITGNLKLL